MHLSILLMAVAIAVFIRLCWFHSLGTWAERWQRALRAFLLPMTKGQGLREIEV